MQKWIIWTCSLQRISFEKIMKNYRFFICLKSDFCFLWKKIWLEGKTYPTPHTRFKWLTPNPIIVRFILNFDKTNLTTNIQIEELMGVWQLISSYLYTAAPVV